MKINMWYKINWIYTWSKKNRPSYYQRVEYIQSSWGQYINTNTYLNANWKVEIKYAVSSGLAWATLFWQRTTSTQRFTIRYGEYATTSKLWLQRSSPPSSSYQENEYNLTQSDTNIHIINFWKNVYLDWNLIYTFSSSSWWNYSIPLYIFALNDAYAWNPLAYSAIKLYYFKIRDENGNLLKEFVPCYRKSDNVIGLYDLVNNQFYTNSWSWTFTKWPDVN